MSDVDAADSYSVRSRLGRLFLPALAVASFSSGPIGVLTALLLVDIASGFNTTVGVAGQINTAYAIAAVAFALLASFLSIKFKHKSLLLAGVLLMTISVLAVTLRRTSLCCSGFFQ